MEIRPLESRDREAADSIQSAAFETLRTVYRPKAAARAAKSAGEPFQELVASDGGTVVGVVEYQFRETTLHFRSLAVALHFQGRGVARALVDALTEMAREARCDCVTLYTIRETGNVAVFEKLGFAVGHEEVADWAESDHFETLTEVLMRRPV